MNLPKIVFSTKTPAVLRLVKFQLFHLNILGYINRH